MNTLTRAQQGLIASLLLVAMLLTRGNFMSHLQDASWAIFFILGFYVRSYLGFPVFWLVAFAIDLAVIESTGSDNFCLTQSYPFLIPAYAAMWFAGRWFAGHYREDWRGGLNLVGAATVGIIVCQFISSGGFYWFSGHFTEPSVTVFLAREATFLPMYMQTALLYIGIAAVVHLAVINAGKLTGQNQAS